MERGCLDDSKMYKLISIRGLGAEEFAIEIDHFYQKSWKFQKSQFSVNFKIRDKIHRF